MIRLIQRKLIIPRGDTGSFSIPIIAAASQGDVAVFTIFNCLTRAKIFQKIITPQDNNLVVEFTHSDTVNLPIGQYVWDIKFYINPQYADNELVDGDEINSYYAGYSLPDCEIRETGDNLLTADNSPSTTLTPESLNILNAAITETAAARDAANAAADSAGTNAATASEQAEAANASATNAAASATNAASSADTAAASATSAANSASAADTSAGAALAAQTGAETAASNAATSAQQAEAYAGQITGLSAQAQTLNAGSAATASYDAATGILDLGIPKGTTFTPSVAADGTISWINDGSLTNPASMNIRGPQGLKGDPFTVKKTFASIAEMQAYSGSDVIEGDFVVISSTIDDPDNAKLFLKAANSYTFITDLSGAEGIKGDTGNGIQSIVKSGTSGLIDTYTITYTDGDITTFNVNNGAVPNFSIGTVTEGANAAATITGTTVNPVLNLVLPNANVPTKVSELENDSHYAIDANYVHTDNNYTTAEKEKLSGITAGAEVNVNADWNANGGDAQILNKPTKVSDFTNDAGYLTSFTETDPTVPAWAKTAQKPSYTASEVGALPSNTHIPSTTAELTNDAEFVTIDDTAGDGDTDVTWSADKIAGELANAGTVRDVQVNGVSVLSDGVANVPLTSKNNVGVIQLGDGLEVYDNKVCPQIASDNEIKSANNNRRIVVPSRQYMAAFYGLAKSAGDTTQSASSNAVGNYTDNAKEKIQSMLGITQMLAPENPNLVATQAYAIDDVFAANGKLYKATSAIAQDEAIIPDTNCTETKLVDEEIKDVQINGTSILSNSVANIPVADNTHYGAIKVAPTYGLDVGTTGQHIGYLRIYPALNNSIKRGDGYYSPVTTNVQHSAAFYGLAKAAGDTTQSASSNAVGNYTEAAKSAISTMLGSSVSVSDTTPTITCLPGVRYVCGEVSTITISPPATGCVDVVFTSGSTPAVLTVTPPAGMTMRWAGGFDPNALEADTVYEVNILDGCLGVAAAWK